MLLSACFYFILGVICSWTFGGEVVSPVTNKWATYTGLKGGWGEGETTWYGYVIQYFILLFPVINLCNTYPLVATTFSSNLYTCFTYNYREKHPKAAKVFSILLAYFPPLLMTCAVGSLQFIFDVSGLMALFLAFLIPTLLELISLYRTKKDYGKESLRTPYYLKIFGNYPCTAIVIVLSAIFFALSIYFLIAEQLVDEESVSEL